MHYNKVEKPGRDNLVPFFRLFHFKILFEFVDNIKDVLFACIVNNLICVNLYVGDAKQLAHQIKLLLIPELVEYLPDILLSGRNVLLLGIPGHIYRLKHFTLQKNS